MFSIPKEKEERSLQHRGSCHTYKVKDEVSKRHIASGSERQSEAVYLASLNTAFEKEKCSWLSYY